MGDTNFYWERTPLIAIYEKHEDVKATGQDEGLLFKEVIDSDKRHFETKKEELIRMYKCVGDEE